MKTWRRSLDADAEPNEVTCYWTDLYELEGQNGSVQPYRAWPQAFRISRSISSSFPSMVERTLSTRQMPSSTEQRIT